MFLFTETQYVDCNPAVSSDLNQSLSISAVISPATTGLNYKYFQFRIRLNYRSTTLNVQIELIENSRLTEINREKNYSSLSNEGEFVWFFISYV